MSRVFERRPRIFLGACGKRSSRLMEWMAQQIIQDEMGTIIKGKFDGSNSSEMIFRQMLDQCNCCDFAVMFLTQEKDDGVSLDIAREITILSAGLFIGGVGLQSQRFIMVSSVPVSSFLLNVSEITLEKINEPPGFFAYGNSETEEWCDTNLQMALSCLIQSIEKSGPYLPKPVMNVYSNNELADKMYFDEEKVTSYERIFSSPQQLIEPDHFLIARAVARNICRYNIDYTYYFSLCQTDSITDIQRWIDFLRVVIAACCIELKSDGTDIDLEDENIQTFIKNHSEYVIKSIDLIKEQMDIYIKKYSVPFDMVILTSKTGKNACYVHQGDCFVEWKSGNEILAARDTVVRETKIIKRDTIFQIANPQIEELIIQCIDDLFQQCGGDILQKVVRSCVKI